MIAQAFRSLRRILLLAFPAALGLLLLFPAVSQAHAILLRSDPAKNAVLTSAPSEVRMWFSEALNPGISKAVILMANQHVADTTSTVSSSNSEEMDMAIQSGLAPGVYLVIWRTQSADDGHILSGSFLFKVANPDGTVPNQTISPVAASALLGNTTSDQFTTATFMSFLMITLVDLGAVFWVGAQLWQTFVLQTEEGNSLDQQAEQRFQLRFSLITLLIILLANMGMLIGQSLSISNGNLNQAFDVTVLHNLIATGNFGTYWTVREVVTFIAILIAVYITVFPQSPRLVNTILSTLNLILGMGLLIAITLSGHATGVTSNILIFSVLIDWLHLLAASLWIGGMLYLSLVYLPVLKYYAPSERVQNLLKVLPHFSPLALAGVIIMAITGPFNATFHMTSFAQLVNTAYGRTLLIKSILVAAMLAVSGIHVFFFRPRLDKDYKKYKQVTSDGESVEEAKRLERSVGRQLTRLTTTLRWEPMLGVAVLLCTGLLNAFAGSLAPATPVATPGSTTGQQQPVATKAYNGTITTSDKVFTVKLNVTPNRFGPNVFTVTVLDSAGKVQQNNVGISLYTTMLDMDMGTDSVVLQPDGKGHFTGDGDLDMGGNWGLRIQIRTLDNKLHEATTKLVTGF